MRQSMLLEGPLSEYEQRIARLTAEMKKVGMDGILLSAPIICVTSAVIAVLCGFQCFHAWYVGAFR